MKKRRLSAMGFALLASGCAILGTTQPPGFVTEHITAEELYGGGTAHRRLQSLFEQKFPRGTPAPEMIATLKAHGFEHPKLPDLPCYPKGQSAPIGVTYYVCYDPTQILKYSWSTGLLCGAEISVEWSTDSKGAIAEIKANQIGACT